MLKIDAGGLLTGFGTANVTTATSAGNISAANGTIIFNAPLTTTGGNLGGPTGVVLLNSGLAISANTTMQGPVQTSSLTLPGSSGHWTAGLDLRNSPLILEPMRRKQSDRPRDARRSTRRRRILPFRRHL